MASQKKKYKKTVNFGVANIKSTFNNTTISLCDILGNTLAWTSAGSVGFKGTRKSTAYAAQLAVKSIVSKASDMGMQKLEIVIRGRGTGRDSAIRTLLSAGLKIVSIEDKTSVPHNGCRPPKKRRL